MACILVMGRLPGITANISAKLGELPVQWAGATTIDEVRDALDQHPDIAIAIMGAGLDDTVRGELITLIASMRPDISIHLKDRESGPAGMAPFVKSVVQALVPNTSETR
jgi:hypothetical protein